MSKTVDQLVVEIRAETKKLRKGLDSVNKKLDGTKKKSEGVNKALKAMAGVIATIGIGKLVSSTVDTIRTFEDLEATLRAVTGSAEGAKVSFEVIREFTKGTTFQIDEVANAFIRLKQAGVVPTSEVLTDFGNLSAGMGKSITQLAQAAFNATTGEMEMLKQFGIKAKLEGSTIVATFDGVTKTIDRSGDAIIDYLRSLGRESFPTAIEERLNTLSGAISNLGDATSEFMVSIGEGGLKKSLTLLSKEFTKVLSEATPVAEMIGGALSIAFNLLGGIVLLLLENLKLLTSIFIGLSAAALVAGISRLSNSFVVLNKIIRTTFATTAGLLSLSGPAGWTAVAVAIGVATTAYIGLDMATKGTNKSTKTQSALDEELGEKVKVNVDFVNSLSDANKRLATSFSVLSGETETTLNGIIFQAGGIDAVTDKINQLYSDFRDNKLEAAKSDPAFKEFFDVTKSLPMALTGDFDVFREEFYQKVFGKSGSEVKDILTVSVVAPVSEVMQQISEIFADDSPVKNLKNALADDKAIRILFDEQVALNKYTGSFLDFKQAIFEFIQLTEGKLSAAQEAIFGIFGEGASEEIDIATKAIENNKNMLKETFDKLILVDESFKDLGLTFDEFVTQYKLGVSNMADDTDDIAKTFTETLAPAIQSASMSFSTTLADALLEGEASLDHFKDFAKSIVSQIIAIFIQMLVVNKILNAIFGSAGLNVFPDDLATMNLSDLGFGKPSGGSRHAGGGTIQGGVPSLVGERGPEIFVPNTGGTVMNNMNSKNAMGGGGTTIINQSINFATGIVPTVRAEVIKMMPQIADVTKAAVQESAMRGGSYRRSLVGG